MNLVQMVKLLGFYEKAKSIEKEKGSMQVKVPQVLTLFCSLSAVLGLPALVTNWVHAHAIVYLVIVAAAVVLHAVMPSVFAAPTDADKKAVGLEKMGMILMLLLCGGLLQAQTMQPTESVLNIYAAGASYNVGGSPAVAGTGLYAHQLNASGTYAFTAVDALPNTVKPFTVTTNIGVGVAQRVLTLGNVPIYMPAATGISWTGANTGWQWNTGALAAIHVKGQYYVMPIVRVLKSSVSNGTGYQPVVGVLFAWGK